MSDMIQLKKADYLSNRYLDNCFFAVSHLLYELICSGFCAFEVQTQYHLIDASKNKMNLKFPH